MRNAIPEGNYSFPVPPSALRYDETGRPAGNRFGIESTHLRGGHYALSSDFALRVRLAGTRAFVAAASFAADPPDAKLSRRVSAIFTGKRPEGREFFERLASAGRGDFVQHRGQMMESVLLSVLDDTVSWKRKEAGP